MDDEDECILLSSETSDDDDKWMTLDSRSSSSFRTEPSSSHGSSRQTPDVIKGSLQLDATPSTSSQFLSDNLPLDLCTQNQRNLRNSTVTASARVGVRLKIRPDHAENDIESVPPSIVQRDYGIPAKPLVSMDALQAGPSKFNVNTSVTGPFGCQQPQQPTSQATTQTRLLQSQTMTLQSTASNTKSLTSESEVYILDSDSDFSNDQGSSKMFHMKEMIEEYSSSDGHGKQPMEMQVVVNKGKQNESNCINVAEKVRSVTRNMSGSIAPGLYSDDEKISSPYYSPTIIVNSGKSASMAGKKLRLSLRKDKSASLFQSLVDKSGVDIRKYCVSLKSSSTERKVTQISETDSSNDFVVVSPFKPNRNRITRFRKAKRKASSSDESSDKSHFESLPPRRMDSHPVSVCGDSAKKKRKMEVFSKKPGTDHSCRPTGLVDGMKRQSRVTTPFHSSDDYVAADNIKLKDSSTHNSSDSDESIIFKPRRHSKLAVSSSESCSSTQITARVRKKPSKHRKTQPTNEHYVGNIAEPLASINSTSSVASDKSDTEEENIHKMKESQPSIVSAGHSNEVNKAEQLTQSTKQESEAIPFVASHHMCTDITSEHNKVRETSEEQSFTSDSSQLKDTIPEYHPSTLMSNHTPLDKSVLDNDNNELTKVIRISSSDNSVCKVQSSPLIQCSPSPNCDDKGQSQTDPLAQSLPQSSSDISGSLFGSHIDEDDPIAIEALKELNKSLLLDDWQVEMVLPDKDIFQNDPSSKSDMNQPDPKPTDHTHQHVITGDGDANIDAVEQSKPDDMSSSNKIPQMTNLSRTEITTQATSTETHALEAESSPVEDNQTINRHVSTEVVAPEPDILSRLYSQCEDVVLLDDSDDDVFGVLTQSVIKVEVDDIIEDIFDLDEWMENFVEEVDASCIVKVEPEDRQYQAISDSDDDDLVRASETWESEFYRPRDSAKSTTSHTEKFTGEQETPILENELGGVQSKQFIQSENLSLIGTAPKSSDLDKISATPSLKGDLQKQVNLLEEDPLLPNIDVPMPMLTDAHTFELTNQRQSKADDSADVAVKQSETATNPTIELNTNSRTTKQLSHIKTFDFDSGSDEIDHVIEGETMQHSKSGKSAASATGSTYQGSSKTRSISGNALKKVVEFGDTSKSDLEVESADVERIQLEEELAVEDPVPISYDFSNFSTDKLPSFIDGKYATGSPVTPKSEKKKKKSHFAKNKSLSLSRSQELCGKSQTSRTTAPLGNRKSLRFSPNRSFLSIRSSRVTIDMSSTSNCDETQKIPKGAFYGSKSQSPTPVCTITQKKQETQKVRHKSVSNQSPSSRSTGNIQHAVDKAKADLLKRKKEAKKKQQINIAECAMTSSPKPSELHPRFVNGRRIADSVKNIKPRSSAKKESSGNKAASLNSAHSKITHNIENKINDCVTRQSSSTKKEHGKMKQIKHKTGSHSRHRNYESSHFEKSEQKSAAVSREEQSKTLVREEDKLEINHTDFDKKIGEKSKDTATTKTVRKSSGHHEQIYDGKKPMVATDSQKKSNWHSPVTESTSKSAKKVNKPNVIPIVEPHRMKSRVKGSDQLASRSRNSSGQHSSKTLCEKSESFNVPPSAGGNSSSARTKTEKTISSKNSGKAEKSCAKVVQDKSDKCSESDKTKGRGQKQGSGDIYNLLNLKSPPPHNLPSNVQERTTPQPELPQPRPYPPEPRPPPPEPRPPQHKPQQNTTVPKSSVTTKPLRTQASLSATEWTFDSMLKQILSWSPKWFQEYDLVKTMPPVVKPKHLFPLLEFYNSYDDYMRIITPHFLLETWQQIYTGWKESVDRSKQVEHDFLPVCLKLDVTQTVVCGSACRVFMDLTCQGILSPHRARFSNNTQECDLVTLDIKFKDISGQSQVKTVLGYVLKSYKLGRKHPEIHKIVADKLKGGPDGNMVLHIEVRLLFRKIRIDETQFIKLQVLDSMMTQVRQYHALCYLPRSPLAKDILLPTNVQLFTGPTVQESPNLLKVYNKSQAHAINMIAAGLLLPYETSKLYLLQGPPGTGKSHAITGLIHRVITKGAGMRPRPRILVCAPSNNAVDELVRRLKTIDQALQKARTGELRVVRIGRPTSIHPDVIDCSLENIYDKKWRQYYSLGRKNSMSSVAVAMDELKGRLKGCYTVRDKLKQDGKLAEARNLESEISKMEKKLTSLDGPTDKHQLSAGDEYRLKREILMGAHVVCCTLNSSGSIHLLKYVCKEPGEIPFTALIVDEAGQSVELDTLIPLQYGLTKLVLVGDPEQLPPTIISKEAADHNYGQSLFERVYSYFKMRPNNPIQMLTIQYRMHKEVCWFPSKHVYMDRLQTDSNIHNDLDKKYPLKHYAVFDVEYGKEQQENRGAICNLGEATFIEKLCDYLLSHHRRLRARDIGVITPYQKQRTVIQQKLHGISSHIEVGTVDGFQGREKGVIIISCVRAPGANGNIGFVADRRRMNVSLTRARFACYVICHVNSLQSNTDWGSLVEDAKERKVLHHVKHASSIDRVLQWLPK